MMRCAALVLLASIALLLASSTRVRAQEPLAEGLALYEQADFAGAMDALESVLAARDLDVATTELALDRVAAAAFALGDLRGLERALGRLARVAPTHEFGLDVPPPVVEQFAVVAANVPPLRLVIEADPVDPGETEVMLRVGLEGDELGAVRAVVLRCGRGGAGHVSRSARPTLRVPVSEACEARAEGPGGIELATAARAPGSGEHRDDLLSGPAAPGAATDGGVDGLALGLGIGGGVLLIGLVVGIAAGVASTSSAMPSEVQVGVIIDW